MADGRLALVVSSQCDDLIAQGGQHELDFLPPPNWVRGQPLTDRQQLPFELYDHLLDPGAGACAPVPGLADVDGVTLGRDDAAIVVNPTLAVARATLRHSFEAAVEANAGLVVHFVGHGFRADPGNTSLYHFLQLADSKAYPVTDDDGWDVYRQLEQLLPNYRLSAFALIVDACYASTAEPAVSRWRNLDGYTPHLWVGSSQQTQAFDGCFTRETTRLLRDGIPESTHPTGDLRRRLTAGDLRRTVDDNCATRVDAETGQTKRQRTAGTANPPGEMALFVGLNRAVADLNRRLGLHGGTADRLLTAREHYQPSRPDQVLDAFAGHDFAVVTGTAGTGKTVLASVLRHPPRGLPLVRVDAVAFLERLTDPHTMALALHPQLATNPAYKDAIDVHRRSDPVAFERETAYERYLDGPLKYFTGRVTLVADGLDQLDEVGARGTVIDALTRLPERHAGKIRVLATSRPEGPIPDGAHEIPMPPLTSEIAHSYLRSRGIDDPELRTQIATIGTDGSNGHSHGDLSANWLVLKLAADRALDSPETEATSPAEIYKDIVDEARADPQLDPDQIDRVVAVLTAAGQVAGVGPRLPYLLLEAAVDELGGDGTRAALYPVLAQRALYRIVERSNPATENEHVGLFHLTAIDALATATPIPPPEAHRAIINAIDRLDPPPETP